MKASRLLPLLPPLLAACAGPRPAFRWEGPAPRGLNLGALPGPDPRDPEPCPFPARMIHEGPSRETVAAGRCGHPRGRGPRACLTARRGSEALGRPQGPVDPGLHQDLHESSGLGGRGLSFSPARATMAWIPADRAPGPEEPLTVAALARVDALPRAKASLVSRWECVPGKRSFDLGVTGEGCLYFTASASGSWPGRALEIRTPPIPVGRPFLAAAAFLPGKCMRILVNGRVAAEAVLGVPGKLFPAPIPVQVGNRSGSRRENAFDGIIGGVWIYPAFLEPSRMEGLARAKGIDTSKRILPPLPPPPSPPFDLDALKEEIRRWYGTLVVQGAPYGAYAMRPGGRPSLYASADLAWIRWICRDLEITGAHRREWIAFLRSRRNPDGTYRHRTGHCPTHAFCHVTGALHMLGAAFVSLPSFMGRYLDPARVPVWLENIRWQAPWGASHDIWGAGLPIACSPGTPPGWRRAFFGWLDREADPRTGFWRKGVPTRSTMESLGGAFHIWVVCAAAGRPLPYPERAIDAVLPLQGRSGAFGGGFGYGNMDALWVLERLYMHEDYRRRDIRKALALASAGLMDHLRGNRPAFFSDAHSTLSRVASLAICSEALPDLFRARIPWRNPWARPELFALSFKKP